jgi:hypothetical protein
VKRVVVLLLAAAVLSMVAAAPAGASLQHPDITITINGVPYHGLWSYVGDRPYVGVESFGKALGLPRQHNVLGWCLNTNDKPCDISPFQLAVEANGKKIPTVRFGGATMVDLRAALSALKIPFHYNFQARQYSVGNPYYGEAMKGAYMRWVLNQYDLHFLGRGCLWSEAPYSPASPKGFWQR